MTNTLANPTLGFQSWQRAEGGSPTAGMTPCWIASTDPGLIFRGDPVITSSGPGAYGSGAYITSVNTMSTLTSTNMLVRGIFQGCYQYQPSAGRVIWSNFFNGSVSGSTGDVKAYIIDDPDAMFLVQASTKGAITSSMIGLNVGITLNTTTGNTTFGYSNVTVESTSVTSSNTQPFRLVDFYSAYSPGSAVIGVSGGASNASNFINGTDNANAANYVIVRLNLCDRLSLTARSS
jgi:hypothetical protein